MAKRRQTARQRRFFSKRSSARRSSGSSENLILVGVAAAGYGLARPYLEQAIAPVTSKIPMLGGYVDEVALGTIGYFAAKGKFGSNKYIKSIGKAMFIVEATRVGSSLGSSMIGVKSTSDYNY